MARNAPKLAADGLPEPLPVRPQFRVLAIILGAVMGLAVVFLLQQMGKILLTTGWIATGLILGIVLGVLLPSVPYILAARHVNSVVAAERKKRAAGPAPEASSMGGMAAPPPQGDA